MAFCEAPAVLSSTDSSGQKLGWSTGSLRVSTEAAPDTAKPRTTEAASPAVPKLPELHGEKSDAKEACRSVEGVRGRQVGMVSRSF